MQQNLKFMILNYIHWNVTPEIFTLGEWAPNILVGWGPRWYGALFALSFVCGYYLMLNIFKKEGIKQQVLDSLSMYMFLGTLIGARLGHCLFYEPNYYLANPLQILYVWQGGLASHGAAIAIPIVLYLFARKYKRPYLWIIDRVALVTALAGFFIRMGNLMNSEIVGKKTTVAWGFVFERLGEDFARHPSQLYEAIAYLFIFLILYYVFNKTKGEKMLGTVSGLFLALIFGFRFFIEFTKEIQVSFERGMTLDMGQWLSIPFVIGGGLLIIFAIRKEKTAHNESA